MHRADRIHSDVYFVGHLFQDRYKSFPVKEDAYFLAALRYIHQNPLRAGLVG